MNRVHFLMAASWLGAAGVMISSMGCFSTRDACLSGKSPCEGVITGSGGGSSGTMSTGTMSTSSTGTGGSIPGCGEPTDNETASKDGNIRDECAVFVATTGDDKNDGSMEKPFKTLQHAVEMAGQKRIFACDAVDFTEAVTLDVPVSLYGGFDCAKSWVYSMKARTALTAPAGAVGLTIPKTGANSKVLNFKITGGSTSKPGESSIGLAADDVSARFSNCDVIALDAQDGTSGQTPTDAVTPGAPGATMSASDACTVPAGVQGGAGGTTTCTDGSSTGGDGGKGGITGNNSGNGENGTDGLPASLPDGAHGTGTDAVMACTPGASGHDGGNGVAGPGGGPATMLSLGGVSGGDGQPGLVGPHGTGGGGGGGTRSGVFCKVNMNTVDGPGASGGGGGAGGCGGKGGSPGLTGGSSIAILSLGMNLSLDNITLKSGKAGNGGNGATGQAGGSGGKGASGGAATMISPSKDGCAGGSGGGGGKGGPGGGGSGGHSIGIAFMTAPEPGPKLVGYMPGTAGAAGMPGDPAGNAGAPGIGGDTAACWSFAGGGMGSSCGSKP